MRALELPSCPLSRRGGLFMRFLKNVRFFLDRTKFINSSHGYARSSTVIGDIIK